MSSDMREHDHINLICTAYHAATRQHRISAYGHRENGELAVVAVESLDELGRILLAQNAASVMSHCDPDHRYYAEMDAHCTDIVSTYRFQRCKEFDPMRNHWLVAVAACNGLRYQSCDTVDYPFTDAAILLDRLVQLFTDKAIDAAGAGHGWRFDRDEYRAAILAN